MKIDKKQTRNRMISNELQEILDGNETNLLMKYQDLLILYKKIFRS